MALRDLLNVRSLRSLFRGARLYVFGKPRRRIILGMRLLYRVRMLMTVAAGHKLRLPRSTQARLWVDKEVFPRTLKLIARARHTVIIQMFIWVDDELGRAMAELLVRVADRGVRVYVSKEAVGDFFELDGDFLTTKTDTREIWRRFWHHPNIHVRHTVSHDHAKVYIIDDHIMLLTGMNIANDYHERIHDYLVELRGADFVQRYLTRGEVPNTRENVKLVMNTERVKEVRPIVSMLLRTAKRSIVIEQGYLSDPEVLTTLIARSREGIHITAVLPAQTDIHHYSMLHAVSRLISEGSPRHLHVFQYPGRIHAKIILIDHRRAFIGSANLITSSLDEMGEVNVLIDSPMSRVLQKLQDVLRRDILKSKPLHTAPVFSWLVRWLTWFSL